MPISLTCPSCERGLKVKDELAGRKIKCPKCSEVIAVPANEAIAAGKPKPKVRPSEDDDDDRPRSKKVERDEGDEEEEEDRPRKKKKKKKKGAGVLRYVIGGVVLAALVVVLVVILMNKNNAEPVVAEKKKEEPVVEQPEEPEDPKPQVQPKPQPKSLAQNIRQAALRPERQNELRQIGLFFKEYVDSRNGKNPATLDEFTNSFRVQFPLFKKLLDEKTYILNLKVNMRAGAPRGIIVYDPLIDGAGHQACGTDLTVFPVPTAELKKLLAQ